MVIILSYSFVLVLILYLLFKIPELIIWMSGAGLTHRGARPPPDTAAGTTAGPRGLAAGWCPGCSAASSGPSYKPSPGSN